jgi:sulfite reductase (NADPH) flavoprotein alpha-component
VKLSKETIAAQSLTKRTLNLLPPRHSSKKAMTKIPVIPETAPFDAMQRVWLNGFLAGLFSSGEGTATAPEAAAPSLGPLLFLFGSQTGTAEGLAKRFAKDARNQGFETRVVGMENHTTIELTKERRVVIITSTYGDGEMPDNAQPFWDYLKNGTAPRLENLEYSVLALGDRNYVQFCQAGKDFDARLEELGARRIHPRSDCDVDYEGPSSEWFTGLMKSLEASREPTPTAVAQTVVADDAKALEMPAVAPSFGKSNPFPALLKTNRVLNAPGSGKETRHLEIILEGSGLEYEVGDALGVVPTNCPDFVREILDAAGLDGEEAVKAPDGGELALRLALLQKFDLKPFLSDLPQRAASAAELATPLRKLQPRLYSISSSPKAHPGEVHLTVAIVRYDLNGRSRKGVCSTYLADRVGAETRVPVFIHKSPSFKLPVDGSRPIIMVGPGTGVAPFRAFLEERRAVGASGKNWLFFGDQRAALDFLYREELEAMQKDGILTKLDTAFSRDQAEKIYVQNRMRENADEIWSWLQEGGYVYVCGDAKRMAKDVDTALHKIAETAGGLSAEPAVDFVKQLKTEKRYLRDVY